VTLFLRRPLARLLARRILLGLLSLLCVSVVVFAATQWLPGDAARAIVGRGAPPERLEALRHQLHLDRSALVQYGLWLASLARLDLGVSLVSGLPVLKLVAPRVQNSLALLVLVFGSGVPLAILLGLVAALRRQRSVDIGLSLAALAIAAVPEFVLGIGLIVLFATVVVHWLPPVALIRPGASVFDRPLALVLPVATLVLTTFPYIFRMMRAAMIDVLDSEYIEMARLNGLSEWRIILVHGLPNALAPTVQAVALTAAYLAGGIVVVEYVFGFPGIGQGLVSAVSARDIPMIQCIVLLLAAFYIGVNIVADLASLLVTPRLRPARWQTS
jgi:peptide/nickel transport system permease protein